MPNSLAYLILFGYPLVVVVLFRRLPLPAALVWSVLAGYLFLPEQTGVNLPAIPTFDKTLIPALAAAVMCLVASRRVAGRRAGSGPAGVGAGVASAAVGRRRPPFAAPQAVPPRRASALVLGLLAVMALTPFGVVLTNGDVVAAGTGFIAALRVYDAFSMAISAGIMVLPFLLARRFLATPEAHVTLLRALVAAGLVYSVLILIEVRLSPQLNKWVYGFYSHSFAQHIRNGGYRPMVFIQHGLRVGIFMAMTVVAAVTLWRLSRAAAPGPRAVRRERDARRTPATRNPAALRRPVIWLACAVWLLAVLFLSKTLGAFAITLLLLPLAALARPRLQLTVAAALAAIVLTYPMLRGAGLVPVERVVALAADISTDRADSLGFRLRNENILLARANLKPLLGWGGWDRNRVFDPVTGEDLSTTDGTWIIVIGISGWSGYLARFGLLTLPIMALAWRAWRGRAGPRGVAGGGPEIDVASSGLCLCLAANLLDLIPNSGLTPLTWMLAGAIMGRAELAAWPARSVRSVRSVHPAHDGRMAPAPPVPRPRPAQGVAQGVVQGAARTDRTAGGGVRPDPARAFSRVARSRPR